MLPEVRGPSGRQDIEGLRWLAVWLPVTAIGCLIIPVGLLTDYLDLPWTLCLAIDLLVLGVIGAGAYAFSGYIFGIVRRKEEEILQQQAELRKSREQLRTLADHLESVREDERSRIAGEIHDALIQPLVALKLDLARLSTRPPGEKGLFLEQVGEVSRLADSTIESARQITTELRPSLLDVLGLAAAIDWQAQDFQGRTGILCEFASPQPEPSLPAKLCTALFRICQETLTNVARHAGATRVRIRLEAEAGHLILTVVDNGRGISDAEVTNPDSLGLLGIRERVLLLGGQVSFVGKPGEGTTVTVRVPLKAPGAGTNTGGPAAGEAPSAGCPPGSFHTHGDAPSG